MKANEFVLKHGWDAAKRLVENNKYTGRILSPSELDLKRLVESHELVEKLGGIDKCKGLVQVCIFKGRDSYASRLKQAIADVESSL